MSEMNDAGIATVKQRVTLETKLYQSLGQFDGYYTKPPMCYRKLYFAENQLIAFCNDGFDVYIGYSDEWKFSCRHNEFRKIIAWYLWQKIKKV